MYNFLTLFYPVVNVTLAEDDAEIARLSEINAGDPFFVAPGWNEETKANSLGQAIHVQRIRMEVALVEHLFKKSADLKEYPYIEGNAPKEGEVCTAYIEAVIDASGYAGQASHKVAAAFSKQLWHRVTDVGNELIENSKLREAMYIEKELGPIKIMVITTPKLFRYLDLHQSDLGDNEQLLLSQTHDTRVENRIFIAVGRMQKNTNIAEPYTYGTLKYAAPTTVKGVDELKSYDGYQMHYEFVDNIPVMGLLEVEGLTTLYHPLNQTVTTTTVTQTTVGENPQ